MKKHKHPSVTSERKETTDVTYTISELAKAAGTVFQTSPDVVTAALKTKGIEKTSLREAKSIVKAYAKKEVPLWQEHLQ